MSDVVLLDADGLGRLHGCLVEARDTLVRARGRIGDLLSDARAGGATTGPGENAVHALARVTGWIAEADQAVVEAHRAVLSLPAAQQLQMAVALELAGRFFAPGTGLDRPRPRVVESRTVTIGGDASGLYVDGSLLYGFRIDRLADGTLLVTELFEAGVGVGVSQRYEASAGSAHAVVDAYAGQELGVRHGRTWAVADPDEADLLVMHQILGLIPGTGVLATGAVDAVQVAVAGVDEGIDVIDFVAGPIVNLRGFGGARRRVDQFEGRLDEAARYDPPPAAEDRSGFDQRLRTGASAGVAVPMVGPVGVEVGAEAEMTAETFELADGGGGVRFGLSAGLTASVATPLAGIGGQAGVSGAVEVRHDSERQPTSVRVETTRQWGDELTVETVDFDLREPAAAEQVSDLLDALASASPGEVADAWAATHGETPAAGVTRAMQVFEVDTSTQRLAGYVAGVGLGVEIVETTLTETDYAGR